MIVLHYTAMASAQAALERLCSPEFEVSAHYLICRTGTVFQMVAEDQRAWHAGAGSWGGVDDINSRSIGIEIDNDGATPFSEPQMAALDTLMAEVMGRWAIGPEAVIGHSDMAPERKMDPGRKFDWRRLAHQGLAIWPENTDSPESHVDPEVFLTKAAVFGYDVSCGLEVVLDALRQRFAPWAFGPLSCADMAIIHDLAARYPTQFAIDRPDHIA